MNPTVNEEDSINEILFANILKKLIDEAMKYMAYTPLMHLHAVKRFVELWEFYKRHPKVKAPMRQASILVARSIGKGKYFARKIGTLYKYIKQFHTLPPVNSGKHHAHPSLLNNEGIKHAVRRYLTILTNGEVSDSFTLE